MMASEANVLIVTSATRARGRMSATQRSEISAEARIEQNAATLRSLARRVGVRLRYDNI
jgi:hypothetical protein